MAIFASTTTSGYSDPMKALSIKALEQRQKDMLAQMAAQPGITPENTQTPIQGFGHLANQLGDQFRQGRVEAATAARRQELAGVMAGVDWDKGPTPQQIAQINSADPELAKQALMTLAENRRAAATNATTARGQDVTARGQDVVANTTQRGQDVVASTAARGQDVTARGQDITARGQDIVSADTQRTQDITARGKTSRREVRISVRTPRSADRTSRPEVRTSRPGDRTLPRAPRCAVRTLARAPRRAVRTSRREVRTSLQAPRRAGRT